jgi:hypothetical protein
MARRTRQGICAIWKQIFTLRGETKATTWIPLACETTINLSHETLPVRTGLQNSNQKWPGWREEPGLTFSAYLKVRAFGQVTPSHGLLSSTHVRRGALATTGARCSRASGPAIDRETPIPSRHFPRNPLADLKQELVDGRRSRHRQQGAHAGNLAIAAKAASGYAMPE